MALSCDIFNQSDGTILERDEVSVLYLGKQSVLLPLLTRTYPVVFTDPYAFHPRHPYIPVSSGMRFLMRNLKNQKRAIG